MTKAGCFRPDEGLSMLSKKLVYSVLFSLLTCTSGFAQVREIAITIDDMPFVGSSSSKSGLQREHDRFLKLVQALLDRHVPATGFVIAGSIQKDQWQLLEQFRENGFELGNHTYSHPSLSSMNVDKYIENVDRADTLLQPIISSPKYFRYPYLAESKGAKKQKVYDYLVAHEYVIAPVTIDSKDYNFNAQLLAIPWQRRQQNLNQMKKRYLAYIWNQTLKAEARSKNTNGKQILLIHANLLNSHFLGDVIDMYLQNGYKIITLTDALKAPAPTVDILDAEVPKGAEATEALSS